jgi:hypothetical protein
MMASCEAASRSHKALMLDRIITIGESVETALAAFDRALSPEEIMDELDSVKRRRRWVTTVVDESHLALMSRRDIPPDDTRQAHDALETDQPPC